MRNPSFFDSSHLMSYWLNQEIKTILLFEYIDNKNPKFMYDPNNIKKRIKNLTNYAHSISNQIHLPLTTQKHSCTNIDINIPSKNCTQPMQSLQFHLQQPQELTFIHQTNKNNRLKDNMLELKKQIRKKKAELGLACKKSGAHKLKSINKVEPFETDILITNIEFEDSLETIHSFYCSPEISVNQSIKFEKYLIYFKINKAIPQNYVYYPFKIICVNLRDYNIMEDNLQQIDPQRVQIYQRMIKFVVRRSIDSGKAKVSISKYRSYYIIFKDPDKAKIWYLFLQQIADLNRRGHIKQSSKEDKWKQTIIKVRRNESKPQRQKEQVITNPKKRIHKQPTSLFVIKSRIIPPKTNTDLIHLDHKISQISELESGLNVNIQQYKPDVHQPIMTPIKWQSQNQTSSKIQTKIQEKKKLLLNSNKNKSFIHWEELDFRVENGEQIRKLSEASNSKSQKSRLQRNRPPQISIKTQYAHHTKQSILINTETGIKSYSKEKSSKLQSKASIHEQSLSNKEEEVVKHRLYTQQKRSFMQESSFRSLKEKSQSQNTMSPRREKKKYRQELKVIAEREANFVREQRVNSETYISKTQIASSQQKKQSKKSSEKSHSIFLKKSVTKVEFNLRNHEVNENCESVLESQSDISPSSDQEEQNKISLEQLKNGIILWKYSKGGWSPHQKKLYLTRNQLQLCYCDINNKLDEKKFYVKDIVEVKYQSFGSGIIKHRKNNIDSSRCLMISVKIDKKKVKCLQFMLSETDPIENLRDFSMNLNNFIKVANASEDEEY